MLGSIHQLAEDVRRQVKKNRELRRHRQKSRRFSARLRNREA